MVGRVTERQQVLDEVCQICVEKGGFRLAAIHLLEADGTSLKVAARPWEVPDDAFRGLFKAVFTFAIPMLLVSNVPVRLLADKLVELKIVEKISKETVRQALKKTSCSLGVG